MLTLKRKLAFASLLLFVFTAGVVTAGTVAPNGKYDGFNIVKVVSGGKELKPDNVPGILYKGSTLVPLGLLRVLGIDVGWDGSTQTASITMPPPRVLYKLTEAQLSELSKAVYKVTAPLPDNPSLSHQGSGFIVDGVFITNYHVAGDSPYAQVEIDGVKQKVSTYEFANKEIDIMGFKVSGGKSLPVSTELPKRGDPVYAIGFAHGTLSIDGGEVHSVLTLDGVTEIIHSAHTEPGESGGIVLNGKGQIVGMNKSGFVTDIETTNIAIAIQYVVENLK